MMPDIHIVFDCGDPDRLARFWMVALPGYGLPHGPPDGFTTWQEWADANEIPEEQRNAGRTLADKQGHRPDIFFLRVPEGKPDEPRTSFTSPVARASRLSVRRPFCTADCTPGRSGAR
jgi:hypothetical protein